MDYVSNLMIRSVQPNARHLCGETFLEFLLKYPLGAKRLQQHLSHFVKNLGYTFEQGRMTVRRRAGFIVMLLFFCLCASHASVLAPWTRPWCWCYVVAPHGSYPCMFARAQVLDMLHSIVMKLPIPVLEAQSQLLFLPLVLRLVGDSSSTCRAAAGTVIKILVRRVGDSCAEVSPCP